MKYLKVYLYSYILGGGRFFGWWWEMVDIFWVVLGDV